MAEILITIKAKTRAKERGISVGVGDNKYVVRTPLAPENDRANKDVVDILSRHFGVSKSKVVLVRGRTSTTKIFKIMA